MTKAKRDVGREILEGIRELKRGKVGGITQFVRIRESPVRSPGGSPLPIFNPPHPGEVLREFVLESAAIEELAGRLGVSRIQFSRVLNGRSAVTADMAIRIGLGTHTTPESWLAMQTQWDLWQALQKPRPTVRPLRRAHHAR